MGAMNSLDRNEYIHNMEIVSHLSGPRVDGGEPMMAMWARGVRSGCCRAVPVGST